VQGLVYLVQHLVSSNVTTHCNYRRYLVPCELGQPRFKAIPILMRASNTSYREVCWCVAIFSVTVLMIIFKIHILFAFNLNANVIIVKFLQVIKRLVHYSSRA
jgi:hypothetical protein